jgi:hypothetical protein
MYLPVRHQGGGNLDEGVVKRWAQDELQGFTGELVGGNLAYDMDGMAIVRKLKRRKTVNSTMDFAITGQTHCEPRQLG